MHGLPLAWAKFERRRIDNFTWKMAVSGQNEIVRGTFAERNSPDRTGQDVNTSQIQFAEPGWYLVVVQAGTGNATTEIALTSGSVQTWVINPMGRWRAGTIVQPIDVAAAANGQADPVVQVLNRVWQPYQRVSIAWLTQTTAANQSVQWQTTSGELAGFNSLAVYVWRFFNYAGGVEKMQQPDRLFDPPQAEGNVTVTALRTTANRWYSPVYKLYRSVTATANNPFNKVVWLPECLADYTHTLRVAILATPGSGATGSPVVSIYSAANALIGSQALTYNATEAVYTINVGRRAAGQQIARVEIAQINATDAFDVEAQLNVTD